MTARTPRAYPRRAAGQLLTALAVLLVWVALVAPAPVRDWTPSPVQLLRLPAEGIALVALLLVPRRLGLRWLPVLVGFVLGVLLAVRVLDMALLAAFYRPFNPLTDWRYAGYAAESLDDSAGPLTAVLAGVAAGFVLLGLMILTPLAVRRVGRVVDHHRGAAARAVVAASVAWLLCASLGVPTFSGLPLASSSAAGLAAREVTSVRQGLHDMADFARQIPVDPFAGAAPNGLLGALRGKDVVVIFVESYGRVAVEESPQVASALTAGSRGLTAAGYSSRSAWLTSPTFGGISWLAHSTLESGLWVSSPQRYDQLLATGSSEHPRLTLARAFSSAGWRTVDVIPANHRDWPEGKAFYGYAQVYDQRTLGYAGPGFGYAPMPDQYTLSAFDRLELEDRPGRARQPVMAQIDLVTSHVPWAPLPQLVDWTAVGDGSVYSAQLVRATSPNAVWATPAGVRTAYGQSVAYSLDSVVSFLRSTHDRNLVVIMLGDHQPVSIVSGDHAGHDVPVSVITRDPAVLERIGRWGWSAGPRPGPAAPVWPMDRFRDRFLTAYSQDHGG